MSTAPKHELDADLPAYLVHLILNSVLKLRDLEPDHILVKAVIDALVERERVPHQLEIDLEGISLLRHQAD